MDHQSWVEELAAQFDDHPEGPLVMTDADNSDITYVLTDVHFNGQEIKAKIARW